MFYASTRIWMEDAYLDSEECQLTPICIMHLTCADDLARQYDKQSAEDAYGRSSICPEQDSFLNIWIIWIVSFCSGKRVVEVVVTRLFPSVRMWIATHAALMSIHKPRRNWQVPKHFVKEYSSDTVVDSTTRFILCDSKSIIEPKPSLDTVLSSAKNRV